MEATSKQTHCPSFKILQPFIRELKLTVVLVLTEYTFFNMAHLFPLSRKAFVMWYSVFVSQQNTFFLCLSNDCQIACSALAYGPSNRKLYNKHLISPVFSVRNVNYRSSFFFHCNLQCGPRIRLMRGMYSGTSMARSAKGLGKFVRLIEGSLYRTSSFNEISENYQNVRYVEV